MDGSRGTTVEDFLNEISLAIQIMTSLWGGDGDNYVPGRASSGSEFEHVYVIGLEEDFFPLLRKFRF